MKISNFKLRSAVLTLVFVFTTTAGALAQFSDDKAEKTDIQRQSCSVLFIATVPFETPSDAVVRIAGVFPGTDYPMWNAAGNNMEMTRQSDGKYSITLNLEINSVIEYKYVMNGSWLNVEMKAEESGSDCAPEHDGRTLTITGSNIFYDTVLNWKGLTTCIQIEGEGTEISPFIISTPQQLAKMAIYINGEDTYYSNKHYKLANDIDLLKYRHEFNDGAGWKPIGRDATPFQGVFDGNNKVIKNLYINTQVANWSLDKTGLFGFVLDGTIKNLGLVNLEINVMQYGNGSGLLTFVGGIISHIDYSSVINCYSTGLIQYNTMSMNDFCIAGGLIGASEIVSVIDCYSTCNVFVTSNGTTIAGGIMGQGYIHNTIKNCYSTGYIHASSVSTSRAGGIVGMIDDGNLSNCAALNRNINCTAHNIYFGRIISEHYGTISNNIAYNNMTYNGSDMNWENIGANDIDGANITKETINADGTLGNRFTAENGWTVENGKLPGLSGNAAEMPAHLIIVGFSGGNGSESNPYIITTAKQLAMLATLANGGASPYCDPGVHYKLGNDIDLSAYGSGFNYGAGWIPIGDNSNLFKGNFDGNTHKITNLYIYDFTLNGAGLFGLVSGGTIKNLGVENVNIYADSNVGGVAGTMIYDNNLINCYSTGKIIGNGWYLGGISGVVRDNSYISYCYSTCEIIGVNEVGGVAGGVDGGDIINCYSTGSVSCSEWAKGGVVGHCLNSNLSNSVALNPSINSMYGGIGRVVGANNYSTLANNIAFNNMLFNNEETVWKNIGLDLIDGADIDLATIYADGTFNGRFKLSNGWTTENGKLPGLFGNTVDMPDHLYYLPGLPHILTTSLPGGTVNIIYETVLQVNSETSVIWSIASGSLPPGLNMSSGSGIIVGTPTTAGTFNITVKATNAVGSDLKDLFIKISISDYPQITTTTLPSGTINEFYDTALQATSGTPVTWSIIEGALPTGIIMSSTGTIVGTPTVTGTFNFKVQATNSAGFDTQELSLVIFALGKPVITITSLPNGAIDVFYLQVLTATGKTPITWAKTDGELPTGLTLTNTGIISGMPKVNGKFTFTVEAKNEVGTDTKTLSLTIGNSGINYELGIRNYELVVYPNPTKGEITVSARGHAPLSNIEIFDISGHCISPAGGGRGWTSSVGEQRDNSLISNEITIDISNVPNGIYFLRINCKTIKIIKR